jgi:hypothetical protein
MQERTFLIIPVSELSKVDFTQVLETSPDTVRKSVDETKTFIKWDGDQPLFIGELIGSEGPYTYGEILDILGTPEWTNPNQFPMMG